MNRNIKEISSSSSDSDDSDDDSSDSSFSSDDESKLNKTENLNKNDCIKLINIMIKTGIKDINLFNKLVHNENLDPETLKKLRSAISNFPNDIIRRVDNAILIATKRYNIKSRFRN